MEGDKGEWDKRQTQEVSDSCMGDNVLLCVSTLSSTCASTEAERSQTDGGKVIVFHPA